MIDSLIFFISRKRPEIDKFNQFIDLFFGVTLWSISIVPFPCTKEKQSFHILPGLVLWANI